MNELSSLRDGIRKFLNLEFVESAPEYSVTDRDLGSGFSRERIVYAAADGDAIPAFLFVPEGSDSHAAVLVHH